jgi:signal transduction histidine kinase
MRDRRILWLIGALGVVVGIAAELIQAGAGVPGEHLLVDLLVGQAFLLGGLFAWSREPRNPTWTLMTAVGFAWYVGSFAASAIPFVHALGVVFADTDAIGLAALVLAYPAGRLERPSERATVIGGAAALTIGDLVLLVTGDGSVALVVGLAFTLLLAGVVARRWRRSTPRRRRSLGPTLVATALTLVAVAVAIVARLADVSPSAANVVLTGRDLVLLAIPLSFVVGFFQQAAERYRALLAAIPDPIARYDGAGRALPLEVAQPDAAPHASFPSLDDLPADVSARVLAAVREALATRRMQTLEYEASNRHGSIRTLETRIVPAGEEDVIAIARDFTAQRPAEAELRASRARIVEAGDEARRRLERDLHDGAQQRLVALVVALRVLHAKATGRVDQELLDELDEATEELKAGLSELRDLAQGIHPAVLTQAGLGAGLTALAERSPIPARVTAGPDRRLRPEVEATAYFVVSEALANAAKHAAAHRVRIAAEVRGDRLEVSVADDGVGGASADSEAGTGLPGLRDRVESLGGERRVISPPGDGTTVTAWIPAAAPGDGEPTMWGIPHGPG